ncbi:hypothetical protein L596_010893 [Steinernema carpocapsae]|uniref:L-Fucosyltransferase n=1 Tax=Steinernema carpocapsae TaxID=34508 RepID=A0A4U5PKT4_STECR|nr:hypothetical protein L596_010893 [Steinernema carpocapsae]
MMRLVARNVLLFLLLFTCFICFLLISQLIQSNSRRSEISQRPPYSLLQQVRVFPQGGSDVHFDQPWNIADPHIVSDRTELRQNYRYIVSNFTYSKGLGNLMFQYASLRSIANQHSAKLIIPSDCLLRRAFDLDAVIVAPEINDLLLKENAEHAVEFKDCCSYRKNLTLFTNLDSNVQVLQGYFQSFRYFHPHDEDMIRQQFRFLPEITIRAEQIIQEAQFEKFSADQAPDNFAAVDQVQNVPDGYDDNYYYIGVHVRRGMDVTWNSRNIKHGHTVAPKEFFDHAMDHFRRRYKDKVVFIVVSDDLAWTQKNVVKASKREVYYSDGAFREVDMALLSQCNETIGSTGTFSWWGSYLAAGENVYYKNWPYKGSMLDKMIKKEDFFLKEWEAMA